MAPTHATPSAEFISPHQDADRLAGVLLGTALGDALGLPAEGMAASRVARYIDPVNRFRLLGRTGFVSDDTEQSALVAQSLGGHPQDAAACARAFRHSLLGWLCRLPWGVGLATLKAGFRIAFGLRRSGVPSAGNGAAMRAAVVGVFFAHDPEARQRFGIALAEVTHLDPRAIAGALFVSELAAALCGTTDQRHAFQAALDTITEPQLQAALEKAAHLAEQGAERADAARELGTTGFVLHTVPFAAYCLLRFGNEPLTALQQAILAGGDTDSIAAILGAWLGVLHGEAGLPADLLSYLDDGPFGPSHLRALGRYLAQVREGITGPPPGYSPLAALVRNLLLYPVILGHGFRRLLP